MPKKKIVIDGEIGWDIYASGLRKQFEEADNQEVEIELSSPGGFISEGLTIFNIIRKYNDEVAKVDIIMMGLAASMASVIMMSVPKSQRKAYDNTIFMIHNAWSFAIGDYRDMQKQAEFLESVSNHIGKIYSENSKTPLTKIRELMDDETWFFGEEMKEAGFIGKILKSDNDSNNKSESLNMAKMRVTSLFDKMQTSGKAKKDIERAVALLPKIEKTPEKKEIVKPESKQEIKMEVKIMPKLKELLSQNPEANAEYNENIQAAKDIGEKNVQDRIDAVIPFLNNENYKGMENLTAEVLSGKTEISALKSAIAVIDNMRETEKSKAAKDDTIDNPDIPALKNDLPKESGEIESEIDFRAEIARKKGVKV